MNEVEKMYKTIFGEFAPNCSLCIKLIDCTIFNNTHNCNKFECDYKRLFTAEKQLELIKWLAYKMHITIGKGLPWGQYDDDWWTVTSKKGYAGTNAYKLEEALANFVNCLWQDLTEVERKQIKEILE